METIELAKASPEALAVANVLPVSQRTPWKLIRELSELGYEDKALATRFGVTREAIRQQRCTNKWLSGNRKAQLIKSITESHMANLNQSGQKEPFDLANSIHNGQKATLLANPEQIKAELFAETVKHFQENTLIKVNKRMNGVDLAKIPIKSIQDVRTLQEIGQKAAGLDKPQVQINQLFNQETMQDFDL